MLSVIFSNAEERSGIRSSSAALFIYQVSCGGKGEGSFWQPKRKSYQTFAGDLENIFLFEIDPFLTGARGVHVAFQFGHSYVV